MNNPPRLTIILPLYDRYHYTRRWFEVNFDPEFLYIVCDGGVESYDESIISSLENPNITYLRFPPDRIGRDFLRKILASIALVKTPYLMLADNDDFLSLRRIKQMIEELDKNPSFNGIHGKIGAFDELNNRYSEVLVESARTTERISNVTGIEAIELCLNGYRYFYYGIVKTSVQHHIYSTLLSAGCNNLYQAEIFQTLLLLGQGKVLWFPHAFYFRQKNPIFSGAQSDILKGCRSPRFDFVLDKSYETAFDNLCRRLAVLVRVDSNIIYDKIRLFLIKSNITRPSAEDFSVRSSLFLFFRKFSILKKIVRLIWLRLHYRYDLVGFKTRFLH